MGAMIFHHICVRNWPDWDYCNIIFTKGLSEVFSFCGTLVEIQILGFVMKELIIRCSFVTALLIAGTIGALSGEADVVEVKVTKAGEAYGFSVTVKHGDEGWDHYANVWEVVGADGTVYGTRILHHPHVNEQPFTRSLSGVEIPDGVRQVIIRAGDSKHDKGGKEMTVALPGR